VAVHVTRAPPTQEGSLDRGNNIAGRIDNLCVACVLVLVVTGGYAINVSLIADEDGLGLPAGIKAYALRSADLRIWRESRSCSRCKGRPHALLNLEGGTFPEHAPQKLWLERGNGCGRGKDISVVHDGFDGGVRACHPL
jgi:hypothetical protein